MTEKISIAMITDDGFVMPTAVALTSLIKNKKKSSFYEINIIAVDCSKENIELLKKFSSKNFQINVKEIENIYANIDCGNVRVTKAALLKFNLANIFSNQDKILYIDGDIIVNSDLSELYATNIEGYYGAMVKDMKVAVINGSGNSYFNSGVMLLNLEKIRNEIPIETFINTKNILPKRYQDQDVFNYLFSKKVKFLPANYNFLTKYDLLFSKKEIEKFYGNTLNNIIVIHYASNEKPWKYKDVEYFDLWFKYYKMSPFGKQKLDLKRHDKNKLTNLEKLFSIRNEDNFYKVIRLCGLKFKIKQNKKEINFLKKRISSLNTRLAKIDKINNFIRENGINKEKIACEIENYRDYGITEEKREQKIIVSLTSYPARMYDIHYCLYSLLSQTLKPDEVILYLTASQFPNGEADIPKKVLNLKQFGLSIRFYDENIKSHTKLIPALKDFPNDLIITADDDIFYDKNCVENLYNSYLNSDRKTIIANRCHRVSLDTDGKIAPYKTWKKGVDFKNSSFLNFLTGVGGVLYPPNVLYKDVLNSELFMQLAPNADDVWFWAMAILNGTKTKCSDIQMSNLKYINPLREMNMNDDGTLCSTNCFADGNDIQMNAVVEQYPQLMDILKEECSKLFV